MDTEVNKARWDSLSIRLGEGRWDHGWRSALCLAALPCNRLGSEGTLATPSFQQMTIMYGRAKPWCSGPAACPSRVPPAEGWHSSCHLGQPPGTPGKRQHHDNSHLPPHWRRHSDKAVALV